MARLERTIGAYSGQGRAGDPECLFPARVLHQVSRHADEMDAIWAQKTPGLAMEEAVLNGRYEGLEAVRGYYVDFFERFYRRISTKCAVSTPGEDRPGRGDPVRLCNYCTRSPRRSSRSRRTGRRRRLCGSRRIGHRSGERQTPGLLALGQVAIDFAREDGMWRIWHFWVGRDFTTRMRRAG